MPVHGGHAVSAEEAILAQGSYSPSVAYDTTTNRFLLVFTDVDSYSRPAIFGLFVKPDASPDGIPFRISGEDVLIPADARPMVAADMRDGGFVLTWYDERTGQPGVYARWIDADGMLLTQTIVIQNEIASRNPVVSYSPQTGKFMISWQQEAQDGDDIYAAFVMQAEGALTVSQAFAIYTASGIQAHPSIAHIVSDRNEYFFITFEDNRDSSSSSLNTPLISAQIVDAFVGEVVFPVELGLDVSGIDGGYAPSVSPTSEPGAPIMVVWQGGQGELLARLMDAEGSAHPPLGHVFALDGTEGQATGVRIMLDESTGRNVVLWQELSGAEYDIYASFIEPADGTGDVFHVTSVAVDEGVDEIDLAIAYNAQMPSFLVAYEATDRDSIFEILLTSLTDPVYPEIEIEDPVYPFEDMIVQYPDVLFDTSVSHTLSVYNDSPLSPLNIMGINTTGPFSVAGENCTLSAQGPGISPCTVTVEFSPAVGGPAVGSLSILSDDPNEPDVSVHLSGMGLAPDIAVTDTSKPVDDLILNFGQVAVGSLSAGTVTARNNGDHLLVMGMVKGFFTPGFNIVADNCSMQMLTPGAFCTIEVDAVPEYDGQYASTIWLYSNDPDEPVASVKFIAEGVTAAIAAPLNIDFGGKRPGVRDVRDVVLSNTGRAPLEISELILDGGAFSIDHDGCTGRSLDQGEQCTVRVAFTADATYFYSGNITVLSGSVDSPSMDIALSGFGTEPIVSVHTDDSVVTVTNLGQGELVLGILDNPMDSSINLESDTCSGARLMYAHSCKITLESVDAAGILSIPTNDPAREMVRVQINSLDKASYILP